MLKTTTTTVDLLEEVPASLKSYALSWWSEEPFRVSTPERDMANPRKAESEGPRGRRARLRGVYLLVEV